MEPKCWNWGKGSVRSRRTEQNVENFMFLFWSDQSGCGGKIDSQPEILKAKYLLPFALCYFSTSIDCPAIGSLRIPLGLVLMLLGRYTTTTTVFQSGRCHMHFTWTAVALLSNPPSFLMVLYTFGYVMLLERYSEVLIKLFKIFLKPNRKLNLFRHFWLEKFSQSEKRSLENFGIKS